MIQKLKDKLMNVGGVSYEALIEHINIQGDIINELVDKVNKLDKESTESSDRVGRWVFYKRPTKVVGEVGYDLGYSCSECKFDLPGSWYDSTKYPNIEHCPKCGIYMQANSVIEVNSIELYRAKESNTYKWVEGMYVKYRPSASGDKWVEGIVPSYASDLYLIPTLPGTVCEFTGITIDNQKIYTGDLLQDENSIYEVVRDGYRFKCKGFYNSSYDTPDDAFSERVSHLKLIGNKFDNPNIINLR